MPSDNSYVEVIVPNKALAHPVSFPQRLKITKLEKRFTKFLKVLRKLHVNAPFIDLIPQIPNYKFIGKKLIKKRKLVEHEIIALSKKCSAII